MAQPPFKTDVLQLEPAASGTRTISRDSTTGGLRFIDPAYPSGVLLADLVGLQSLTGVAVVGTTVETIQEAIDDAPTGGATPVILVPSGEYAEDLTISKDVVIVGLGYVRILNATATSTVTLVEDADGVPRFVQLRNLTIECSEDGESCVFVDGSHTFATGTITVNTTLVAGDTITINGNVLTGIAGARTSGSDNFNASLGTVSALAAEIAAAINDVANSFTVDVTAAAALGVVTIEAAAPGAWGNAITLAVATTPGGGLSVSGATLAGGGGVNSEVGLTEVALLGCDLVASGIGTRPITTQIVCNVRVSGGSWFGSSSTSELFVSQTASFKMSGVEWVNDVQAAYDDTDDQPAVTTSEFSIVGCGRVNDLITNFIGEGSVVLANLPVVGDITINGDRGFSASYCRFGNALIEDTVVATLVGCTRGTLGGIGTPTVAESSLVLSLDVVASNSAIMVFDRPQPDALYTVLVDVPSAGITSNVTARSTTGFTVTFSALVTDTVWFTVLRQM